jgi:hypothetical protein
VHAITGDLLVNSTQMAEGGVLPLLHSFSDPQDIFIMNFGLWHGRPNPFARHLAALADYYRATHKAFPHQFWMQTPKQHFDSSDGDFQLAWLGRKGPWECKPLANISRDPVTGTLLAAPGDEVAAYVAAGTWRNIMAAEELGQAGMGMIPIYNVTVPAWDKHRSNPVGPECSHYCHPGIPQQWVAVLHQALADRGVQPLPAGYRRRYQGPVPCLVAKERDEHLVTAAAAVAAAASERPKPVSRGWRGIMFLKAARAHGCCPAREVCWGRPVQVQKCMRHGHMCGHGYLQQLAGVFGILCSLPACLPAEQHPSAYISPCLCRSLSSLAACRHACGGSSQPYTHNPTAAAAAANTSTQ